MANRFKAIIDKNVYYKTREEIKNLIKEFFHSKGEELTEENLERTVRAYIYLTDDDIPVSILTTKKRRE